MSSIQSTSKPALRLNTKLAHPRLAGVHFDTPMRSRASTRGSPVELIGNSPPLPSQPDYDSCSSDSEDEFRMRGRPSRSTGHMRSELDQGHYVVEQPSPFDEMADAEQFMKEPRPPDRVHTNLFGILASSTTFNEMDLARFGGHRDTLASLTLRRVQHSKFLPIEVFSYIVHYLDFQSYKSVRLTCRCWSAAFTYVRPLRLPPVYFLPAEIIKHVYGYLSLTDLNAARHTCRNWMIASLDYRLLATSLEQVGLRAAFEADTIRNEELGHPIGGEWRLSKRLATECSLRPGWSGDGFIENTTMNSQSSSTSLVTSGTVDFAGVSMACQTEQSSSLRFTVSACGTFLLHYDNTIIHVYCIRDLSSPFPRYKHGGYIEFLVAILCPRPVLSVSMDASKDRYTIAALLHDRVGVIMDVPELAIRAKRSGSSSPHSERDTRNTTKAWELKASPTATPTTSQRPKLPPSYTDFYHASPITQPPEFAQPSPIPVQFIPHILYRNLCSKTSPPLSVAICPYRRCVAFGCSAGIELHWQDARTGQELSRWIELIGPAQYIQFLPLRTEGEVDIAQTIRLASSRSGPTYYHDPILLDEAWDHEHCRFLRAVPLSDGKHILYTDPASGDLCIGTGLHSAFGRPKPVKKFVLKGPRHPFEAREKRSYCYRGGSELTWGAKIVAAFGDQIWLFCVPPDFLFSDIDCQTGPDETCYPRKDGMVIIEGTIIGEAPDVVELAVDASRGDLTIHAFSSTAPAKIYQITRYPHRDISKRLIANNGRITNCEEDGNENLLMKGYLPDPESVQREEHGNHGLEATAFHRLDGHDLPFDDGEADDSEDLEIEMKEHAVGDWIHDTGDAVVEDEGYESGDDDEVERDYEWGWSDGIDGDHQEPDRSREGNWHVMELVRLEIEVLCGG